MIHPVLSPLIKRTKPGVKLLDVVSDVSDLTTYTFNNVNLGELGGSLTDTVANPLPIKALSNRVLVAIVHGRDALTTFTVSTVTVGTVSMTKRVDRGGGTNAINTAIFTVDSAALAGMTSETVSVTFSEAVTACAVGLLLVDNVQSPGMLLGTGSGTSTGSLSSGTGAGSTEIDMTAVIIVGTTCATAALGENVLFTTGNTGAARQTPLEQPTLLYESSNAEMSYAAYYATCNQYAGYDASVNVWQVNTDWSGTGAFDHAFGVMK